MSGSNSGTPGGPDPDRERDVAAVEERYSAALTEEEIAHSLWNEAREYETVAFELWRQAAEDSRLAFDLYYATVMGPTDGGSDL